MPDWGMIGLFMSPVVVVKLIEVTVAGIRDRKRARGQKVTDLDIALASRSRWIVHSRQLRHEWWTHPRPELPPEPDDPWPPSEKKGTT